MSKTALCDYCGAEMKLSRKNNLFCSNICWTKEPYKTQRLQDQLDNELEMDTKHGDWGCRD